MCKYFCAKYLRQKYGTWAILSMTWVPCLQRWAGHSTLEPKGIIQTLGMTVGAEKRSLRFKLIRQQDLILVSWGCGEKETVQSAERNVTVRYQEKFPKMNCQHLEENVSGDCRSPCRFLRTGRTRLCKNGWGTADPGLEPRGSRDDHYQPYSVCA